MSKKIIYIILTLVVGGTFFFIDEIFTEPISDELLYRFKLGEYPLGDEDYTEHIQTLEDVFVSQYHQYFHSNGRYIVHVFVQAFDGLAPRWVFAAFNAVVLLCVMTMLMAYTMRTARLRCSPLMWTATLIMYFYAFPGGAELFISMPGAFNYLWPMMLVLGFLLLWKKVNDVASVNPWLLLGLALFCFIAGWSQECFALPLSAAIFVSLIINRRQINSRHIIMAVALFAGAAILTFAPGNFVRLSSTGRTGVSGFALSALSAVKLLLKMKIIWLLVATIVWAKFRGLNVRGFIRRNQIESLCLSFAVLLGFAANTLPQSFTGIEFFALIIIYRIVDSLELELDSKYCRSVAVVLLLMFSLHQSLIAHYRREMMTFHQEILKEYIDSPDGVILKPEANLPALVRPFVPDWTQSQVAWWTNYTIAAYYGSKDKSLQMLSESDFEIVRNPSVLNNRSLAKVAGSLGCVQTESGYWCGISHSDTAASIQLILYPKTLEDNPTWFTKLKFTLAGNHEPDTIVKAMTCYNRYMSADSLMIVKINRPFNRRVKEINILR